MQRRINMGELIRAIQDSHPDDLQAIRLYILIKKFSLGQRSYFPSISYWMLAIYQMIQSAEKWDD